MNFKKERYEKAIEREVGRAIITDIKDSRIKFVTITNVDLTSDLSIAYIFYTVLGNEEQSKRTTEVLHDAKGYIRNLIAKKVQMKKVPELVFKYDRSSENAKKIEEILQKIKEQ